MTVCAWCGGELKAGSPCTRCADAGVTPAVPVSRGRGHRRGRHAGALLVGALAALAALAWWAVPAVARHGAARASPAPEPTLTLNQWQQQVDLTLTFATVAAHPRRYAGARIMWECQISTPAARDPTMPTRRDAACQVYGAGGTGAGGAIMLRLPSSAHSAAVVGATVIVFGAVTRPSRAAGGALAAEPWIDVAYVLPDQFGGD